MKHFEATSPPTATCWSPLWPTRSGGGTPSWGLIPSWRCSCIERRAAGRGISRYTPTTRLTTSARFWRTTKVPDLTTCPPFTGGLVGYFSYDYLAYSEPSVKCPVEDSEAFQDVDLMLFDKVIAFDHARQKIILIVNMSLDDVGSRLQQGSAGAAASWRSCCGTGRRRRSLAGSCWGK